MNTQSSHHENGLLFGNSGGTGLAMGARRIFSEGGGERDKITNTLKSWHVFVFVCRTIIDHFSARQRRKQKICVFCDVIGWNIGCLWRAPKAPAIILGCFVGRQRMTSFFSNSRGGGKCPPCERPWPELHSTTHTHTHTHTHPAPLNGRPQR